MTATQDLPELFHCENTRSLRPLWTLEELGCGYQLVKLSFPPRVHHREYLDVNPLGTVPCLRHAGRRFVESNSICDYLVSTFGANSGLIVGPAEPERPNYLEWISYGESTLTFPLTVFLRYTVLEPEQNRSIPVAKDYKKFFLGRLRLVDIDLKGKEYLCASRLTLADVSVWYALHMATVLGMGAQFSPEVQQYYLRLRDRPALQRALSI